MTAGARPVAYPLDALHRREAWRLDALQAELAAVSRQLAEGSAQHEALRARHRAVALGALPRDHACIDPASARSRLAYLSDLQGRMKATAHALVAVERSQERLRAARGAQQTKLESIERHRRRYAQDRAAEAARIDAVEADRDWVARLHAAGRFGASVDGDPRVDGDSR